MQNGEGSKRGGIGEHVGQREDLTRERDGSLARMVEVHGSCGRSGMERIKVRMTMMELWGAIGRRWEELSDNLAEKVAVKLDTFDKEEFQVGWVITVNE
jgi:hypothetical protein